MILGYHNGSFQTIVQAALGTGIEITNAGGAGFKAWEVVKVAKNIFSQTEFCQKKTSS